MADSETWRSSISAVDRYDTIQQMCAIPDNVLGPVLILGRQEGLELIDPARKSTSQGDAMALERQAWDAATSLVRMSGCLVRENMPC